MRTSAGLDFEANLLGNPANNGTGAFAPASYIAVSTDTNAAQSSDIALPGEITSGSLSRTLATFAHTPGTSSYTLSALFVADHSVTLAKLGVYNAPVGGTLFLETLLTNQATLNSGDQLTITENVSL